MEHITLVGILVILTFTNTPSLASSLVDVKPCTEDGDIPAPVAFSSEGCIEPPCPLVKGTTANANITFKIPADTDSLNVNIKARVLGLWVPFAPDDSDVCHSLLNSYCPVDTNEVVVYNMAIPVKTNYPSLSMTLKVKVLDEKNRVIMCMKVDCEVVKK